MPFSEIELYDNKKSFLLVPVNKSKVASSGKLVEGPKSDMDHLLHIDRSSGHMKLLDPPIDDSIFDNMSSMTRIRGVLGTIDLLSGRFLIVILKRDYVGSIKKHKVYRLSQIQFIPLNPGALQNLSDRDREREYNYIEMVNRVFVGDRAHYFSYTCDLTLTFQKQSDILDGSYFKHMELPSQHVDQDSMWQFSHERFFWNHHLSKHLREGRFHGFIIPIIRGYVEVITNAVNKKKLKFGLISRVGSKRSGTRYNTRGADLRGNVANYVETEQFVLYDGIFACFLQVRGSVPLIWTQYANLKYTPEIKFHKDNTKQAKAFKAHMNTMFDSYGDNISAVNLCKKKNQELHLSKFYETLIAKVPLKHKIDYHAFDFHAETKGLRMDRISILIDAVKDKIQEYGFYVEQYKSAKTSHVKSLITELEQSDMPQVDSHTIPNAPPDEVEDDDLLDFGHDEEYQKQEKEFEEPSSPAPNNSTSTANTSDDSHKTLREQSGVFRVNCVDCCDRTNVVETAFGRVVLEQQLKLLGIFSKKESILHHSRFNKIFQHIWANNGDRVSSLYAGTGALMGDFTRTGQRSVVGFMKDGVNAVSRYVQNNFKDSVKQRSLHLVLGMLDIHSAEESNNTDNILNL